MEYGTGFDFMQARSAVVFNPNLKASPDEMRRNTRLISRELLGHAASRKTVADFTSHRSHTALCTADRTRAFDDKSTASRFKDPAA